MQLVEFLKDIWKKLLVSVVAGFISGFAAWAYANSISEFISTYDRDWYQEQGYWALLAIAIVVCLGYAALKYNYQGVFLAVWLVACLVFAVHRSKLLPFLLEMPVVFFVLFCVVVLQAVAIAGWAVCKVFSQKRPVSSHGSSP
jgi:hypothetical protein